MGEYADYAIERMMFSSPRFKPEPKQHFCKTCGEEIFWKESNGKWFPCEFSKETDKLVRHYCKPEELR